MGNSESVFVQMSSDDMKEWERVKREREQKEDERRAALDSVDMWSSKLREAFRIRRNIAWSRRALAAFILGVSQYTLEDWLMTAEDTFSDRKYRANRRACGLSDSEPERPSYDHMDVCGTGIGSIGQAIRVNPSDWGKSVREICGR